MEKRTDVTGLVLRAVALAMAVAAVVLGLLPDGIEIGAQVTLLGIGLFALALAALRQPTRQ